MSTAIYSMLHMLVDGVCALAMYGQFTSGVDGYWNILIYNFCAFALQMPFGVILDTLIQKKNKTNRSHCKNSALCYAMMGCILTVAGAVTSPVILGVGNALFHVGGGVGTIEEDNQNHWKGRALGIFVAPGALGLFAGMQITLSKDGQLNVFSLTCASVVMVLLLGIETYRQFTSKMRIRQNALTSERCATQDTLTDKRVIGMLILGCFLVVIIRSHVGMAITFPWKTTLLFGTLSTLAVVSGKMLGGIFAAKYGYVKVILVSLILASVGYILSDHVAIGLAALLCFNMTMPITLSMLVDQFPKHRGFFFGLLTFGLFLGFLPTYMNMTLPLPGNVLGAVLSMISMLLLIGALPKKKLRSDTNEILGNRRMEC